MSEISVDSVENVPPLDKGRLQLMAFKAMSEVVRQDDLARAGRFGGAHVLVSGPNFARMPVLMEEVGEVARELNEGIIHDGIDRGKLLTELVQVAAVALAWATALEGEIEDDE